MSDPAATPPLRKAVITVVALCWVFVLLDGCDLFVYSAVLPRILKSHALGITAGQAGDIGSYTTFGMLVGALCAGTLSDWIGRKSTLIASVTLFSLASAATAAAPSAAVFGGARLVAGLGLGGLLPTAIAYVMDYSRPGLRNLMVGVIMTAHQTGGIVAAALGLWVVPSLGWRSVFWLGAIPAVIVVPLAFKLLPESMGFLLAKGRRAEAEVLARCYLGGDIPITDPTAPKPDTWQNLKPVHPLTVADDASLLVRVVRRPPARVRGEHLAPHDDARQRVDELGSAVGFLLVINLGGIFGLLTAGRLSDRIGSIPVTVVWFAFTAVGTGLLAVHMPLAFTYTVVFLTGALLFSAQTMVYATVGGHHAPESLGATAVGWVAGIGRFGAVFGPWLGGRLVAADASDWGFAAFSIAAVVGAVMMAAAFLTLRRRPAPRAAEAVLG